jgi:hypothetical protein
MDYDQFVQQKRRAEVATGHQPGGLNEHLFDFQHAIVSWAVRRGRAAIFADTGIGSEGYTAVKMGRRFVGTELKPQYWNLACQNIEDATRDQIGLFAAA